MRKNAAGQRQWDQDGIDLVSFDPLNDLNAMHKAESTLDTLGRMKTAEHLNQIVNAFFDDYYDGMIANEGSFFDGAFTMAHATARQRAEAFLRTVGRWVEE